MKNLIAISSTKRNPTKHIKENSAISKEYLLLVDGTYAWGRFSFISHDWVIVEKFKTSFCQNNKNLIWFEESPQ